MGEGWEYLYGAIGGAGALCVYYGINRAKRSAKDGDKRLGLRLVNGGVVLVAVSFALMMFAR